MIKIGRGILPAIFASGLIWGGAFALLSGCVPAAGVITQSTQNPEKTEMPIVISTGIPTKIPPITALTEVTNESLAVVETEAPANAPTEAPAQQATDSEITPIPQIVPKHEYSAGVGLNNRHACALVLNEEGILIPSDDCLKEFFNQSAYIGGNPRYYAVTEPSEGDFTIEPFVQSMAGGYLVACSAQKQGENLCEFVIADPNGEFVAQIPISGIITSNSSMSGGGNGEHGKPPNPTQVPPPGGND